MLQVVARPAYERVGRAFRQAYEAADLQQKDIAVALGVDPATVSKWSRGLQRIELEYFPEIDKLCGVPLGTILRRAGYVAPLDDQALTVEQMIQGDPRLTARYRREALSFYDYCVSRSAEKVTQ